MAYCLTNYKTKKALKEDFHAGKEIKVYQPGGIFDLPKEGSLTLEGPHYPQPHRWYAQAEHKSGVLTKLENKAPKNGVKNEKKKM